MMNNKQYAIIGMIATILFWISYFTLSLARPEYSFLTKAISELGSMDAPNKWWWNYFGYTLPGLFISIFSFGFFKSVASEKESKLPMYASMLSGIFMSLSGFFPGDFDNRNSFTMIMHSIGSFGSYFFFLIAAFTYLRVMRKSEYWKQMIRPTLSYTGLTILFGAWPFVFNEMPAVGQRIVFFFYLLWILHLAYKLYHAPDTFRKLV